MQTALLGFYVLVCTALVAFGMYFACLGLPYITNNAPREKLAPIKYYDSSEINSGFTFKLETYDAFTANNPIDVSVTTSPLSLDKIRSMQLIFEGAEKVFTEKIPERPPINSPPEVWLEYEKAIEAYDNREAEARKANVLYLKSDVSIDYFRDLEARNISITHKTSTFSGSLKNLTYASGGDFAVSVTVIGGGGNVSQDAFTGSMPMIKGIMVISPPETMLQIKSNNLFTGLGWIGLGIPFLLAGFTGFLEILKHFVLS